jgi:valyl-tRNA synthetase
MSLSSVYEPDKYESDMYALWEKSGAFVPKERGGKGNYSIVVPPPNANGNLHIGHALTFALQDTAIRFQRMKGKAALFLPGADHAGFETQVVYEKELAKEGKSRFDLSREELYDQVWKFVAKNRENYQGQFRRLGASVDWDHFTFTLDKKIVDTAYKTFKKMWDDKLIYRGERLVNFCTFHGTAFADIEVEYKTEIGKMYYIHFPLTPVNSVTDKKDYILIATTRPETMLGDVAVAVHPDDKRFKHLVGRTVTIPLANREVPIIADTMVDTEFGTGAVKITAAHDPNDFDVAQKHNLPLLKAITEEGTIGHDAPHAYHSLTVSDARKRVTKELEEQKLLEKIEEHEHRVGHCYKCGTVIQPLVRDQWFVDMKPLAKKAITALKNNEITFYPTAKQDQLITYLEGLRDWNISRQIAWGIPIPAFQNVDNPDDWIFDTRVEEKSLVIDGKTYRRDSDVFDTWFSSGQWPFATLNYPDGEDYQNFYPLSVMETGVDILAPWVSRMIMLGLYITGKVPFKAVYLHGLVLDEHGAKMSKSKGNVVNPMDMIDLYGSDALRMGIMTGQSAGNNQPFGTPKIIGARNFCNKLWNIARYVEGKVGDSYAPGEPKPQTPADHWVLSVLQQSAKEMDSLLSEYRFAEAYEIVYHTIWDDVADWYIEASKSQDNPQMLAYVLETILTLAHPFAPFVTEAIWQQLGWQKNMLITTQWPTVHAGSKAATTEFEELKNVVTELRQLIKNIGLSRPLLTTKSELLTANGNLLTNLAKIGGIEQGREGGVRLISAEAWLHVEPERLTTYKAELKSKISKKQAELESYKKRLGNKAYIENAPEHVVQQTHDQLELARADLELLKAEAKQLN